MIELPTVITEYLDALPDEAIDRLLEAPADRWCNGYLATSTGRRCLRGHAEDWRHGRFGPELADDSVADEPWFRLATAACVAGQFDELVAECRGDVVPVVRAIRAYIARTRNPRLVAPEPVEAGCA